MHKIPTLFKRRVLPEVNSGHESCQRPTAPQMAHIYVSTILADMPAPPVETALCGHVLQRPGGGVYNVSVENPPPEACLVCIDLYQALERRIGR